MEGVTKRSTAGEFCGERSWHEREKSGVGEAGAGVLRVEKENRAKEGEADAFFAGM